MTLFLLTSKSTLNIVATIACLALFFHPSVWKVAFHPFNFSLSSTFVASRSSIGPDKVQRSGMIVPGIHLSKNNRTSGLCAVFQEEWVAISSLQKSSPNSCSHNAFHALPAGLWEPSGVKLKTLARFNGRSRFSNGVDSRSGLGIGDPNGVAEVLKPGFG